MTTQGMQRIRATLRIEGDELHLDTNGEARLPTKSEAMHRAGMPSPTGGTLTNELDPNDPGVAAVLGQMARQYEQAWLDDAIPALAGHTPREVAADPTRRPDLIRLLDSFPQEQDRPGLMNPDRLRAELGLH